MALSKPDKLDMEITLLKAQSDAAGIVKLIHEKYSTKRMMAAMPFIIAASVASTNLSVEDQRGFLDNVRKMTKEVFEGIIKS